MKTGEYFEFDIFVNCHFCLTKQEVVTDLCVKAEGSQELLRIYSNLIKFELSINYDFPFNICKICKEKLQSSFNFLEQCKNSHELIRQYITKSAEQVEEYSPSNVEKTVEEDVELTVEEEKVKDNGKQRLEQFPFEAVNEAIRQADDHLRKIKCFKCGFEAVNTKALSLHMSHIHKDLKEKWCPQCNQVFDNLTEHSKEHAKITCQFCQKTFHSKYCLKEHLRSHSGIRPYNCNTCEKSFITSRHLRAHCRMHANEKPYSCRICGKAFVQYGSLNLHVKQHKQTEPEQGIVSEVKAVKVEQKPQISSMTKQNFCELCHKKVRSLTTHNKKEHGDGAREESLQLCTVCGKRFKTNSKLNIHMRIHTGESPYKCHYCEKRVSTRNQLVVHERTHTGEKPHVCYICGKAFAQSSVLKTHMRLHTGRPEVCTICDQRFCRPVELRLHMRKHTGEKPFHCTTCTQSFSRRSHLIEHIKIHSDERPYKCSYCDRGFKQSSSLKTHEQIHSGEKPYQCSQCAYACRQSYSLTLHMKQHVEDLPRLDRPYACSICLKTFTTNAMLNSHSLKVHIDGQY